MNNDGNQANTQRRNTAVSMSWCRNNVIIEVDIIIDVIISCKCGHFSIYYQAQIDNIFLSTDVLYLFITKLAYLTK